MLLLGAAGKNITCTDCILKTDDVTIMTSSSKKISAHVGNKIPYKMYIVDFFNI